MVYYLSMLACQPLKALNANTISDDLIRIEPGAFQMGAPFSEDGFKFHEMQHVVRLTQPFNLSKTEVTREQWNALMSDFSTQPCTGNATELPSQPANCLSWCEIVFFLNRLSIEEGLTPAYRVHDAFHTEMNAIECNSEAVYVQWEPLSDGFRLPTEAEWEYAARAGFGTVYSGSSAYDKVAWGGDSGHTVPQPVGQLQPNYWGLYDMSGNVSEWVWDHYDLYLPHQSVDPTGPVEDINDDGRRIVRGGGFLSPPNELRVASRGYASPAIKSNAIGFRIAQTIYQTP